MASLFLELQEAIEKSLESSSIDPKIFQLVSQGAKISPQLLMKMCSLHRTDIIRVLFAGDQAPILNNLMNAPFRVAMDCGNMESAKILLSYGANVDVLRNRSTALMDACCEGRTDKVRFLLSHGADASFNSSIALAIISSSSSGNACDIALMLLKAGASAKKGKFHPLLLAYLAGNDEIVPMLLFHGADMRDIGKHDARAIKNKGYHSAYFRIEKYRFPMTRREYRIELEKMMKITKKIDYNNLNGKGKGKGKGKRKYNRIKKK